MSFGHKKIQVVVDLGLLRQAKENDCPHFKLKSLIMAQIERWRQA
jgi:hypothetical protein